MELLDVDIPLWVLDWPGSLLVVVSLVGTIESSKSSGRLDSLTVDDTGRATRHGTSAWP